MLMRFSALLFDRYQPIKRDQNAFPSFFLGLGQITDKKDNIKYHLNLLDLIKDINENVLPTVCNEEGKITSLAVDTD